jgi:hypothetical protein
MARALAQRSGEAASVLAQRGGGAARAYACGGTPAVYEESLGLREMQVIQYLSVCCYFPLQTRLGESGLHNPFQIFCEVLE